MTDNGRVYVKYLTTNLKISRNLMRYFTYTLLAKVRFMNEKNTIESLLDLNDDEIKQLYNVWDKCDCSLVGLIGDEITHTIMILRFCNFVLFFHDCENVCWILVFICVYFGMLLYI